MGLNNLSLLKMIRLKIAFINNLRLKTLSEFMS